MNEWVREEGGVLLRGCGWFTHDVGGCCCCCSSEGSGREKRILDACSSRRSRSSSSDRAAVVGCWKSQPESIDDYGVTCGHGQLEAIHAILCSDCWICTVDQQQIDDGQLSFNIRISIESASNVEGCEPEVVLEVWFTSVFQEHGRSAHSALGTCTMKRGIAQLILLIQLKTSSDQPTNQLIELGRVFLLVVMTHQVVERCRSTVGGKQWVNTL
mmetsp:Transcript_14807/g.44417  ORF Transcript_14807/g.44417 Transcript_14807/m.44417 type:complete len:214 (-) Transcript_14807:454-1095(-)